MSDPAERRQRDLLRPAAPARRPLVLAVASVWHFLRGRAWFNGERERPLRAEESGARPIAAPLIGGSAPGLARRRLRRLGPALAEYRPRFGAYLRRRSSSSGILTAAVVVAGFALGSALGGGIGNLMRIAGIVGGVLITLGYFPYFWSHGGVRRRACALPQVRVDPRVRTTGPLTWGNALKRYVVFVFGAAGPVHRLPVGVRRPPPQGVARHRRRGRSWSTRWPRRSGGPPTRRPSRQRRRPTSRPAQIRWPWPRRWRRSTTRWRPRTSRSSRASSPRRRPGRPT